MFGITYVSSSLYTIRGRQGGGGQQSGAGFQPRRVNSEWTKEREREWTTTRERVEKVRERERERERERVDERESERERERRVRQREVGEFN